MLYRARAIWARVIHESDLDNLSLRRVQHIKLEPNNKLKDIFSLPRTGPRTKDVSTR